MFFSCHTYHGAIGHGVLTGLRDRRTRAAVIFLIAVLVVLAIRFWIFVA
jgi:hypothetical protein